MLQSMWSQRARHDLETELLVLTDKPVVIFVHKFSLQQMFRHDSNKHALIQLTRKYNLV